MSYYGEEFGDTCKQVKLQDLKKVMTKLGAEERSRRKAAAESKHQAQAEWHSATAAGINYALALLDVLAKKAL